MSIIKRKKQDKFFIMSNHATQHNLTSLSSIGLLAYIKSLPHDWTLYKTYLQKKFTRRTVDSAWSELVDKNYIAGFSCYVDRKKQYYYLAHDEPLIIQDFNSFVEETLEEIKEEGFTAKNLQPIKDCNFSIAQNVQHMHNTVKSSNAHNVQHKEYSTTSAVPSEQIQINTNKEIPQINTNKEINNVNNIDLAPMIIDSLFLKHGNGLFSRNEWLYFSNQIISEINIVPNDLYAYLESVVKTIIYKRMTKLGINQPTTEDQNFYNWLEH